MFDVQLRYWIIDLKGISLSFVEAETECTEEYSAAILRKYICWNNGGKYGRSELP